ncbi:MAG TPA: peptidoglycan DD-metalloendopeptidase family protein [Verrucomicrobiae bacterium]|nr:peptidoglycan DD-metalloendopeptidase family protein [Verrucomicrobiae bacterium]
MIRRLAAAFVAAVVLAPAFAAGSTTEIDRRIEAEKTKAQAIHQQLQAKRAQLQSVTLHYQDLQSQLSQTNDEIASVNAHIGDLAAQAAGTQRRIDWNTVQLDAAKRSLELHDEMLAKRLVGIYEYGNLTYLSALLSARSFSDFVERWEDVRLLIAANERAIRARKVAEERVAAVEAALQSTEIELQSQEEDQQRARSQLDGLASERANLVELAAVQRRHVAAEVTNMEDISAAEEAELESLIQERERELEAERKARGIAAVPEGAGGAGMFSWPITGPITSPFGWRSNPFGGGPEFHPGLDIAAPTGTTVTAAAAGTVIMAQWYGGYGNYILIDHGGGWSTGYGHLSAIYVSNGQTVARGQAIGAVGTTGQSTGPHLHFEVRFNGKPVDPAPRLH